MLPQVNYGFELYFCLLVYFFSKFFISSLMTFSLRPSGLFDVYIFTILICRKILLSLGIDYIDTGRIL